MSADSNSSTNNNATKLIKTSEPDFTNQRFQTITGAENKLKTPLYQKLKASGLKTHIAHQEELIIKVSKIKKYFKLIGRLEEFEEKVGKDKFLVLHPDFIVHSANLIIEVNGSCHELPHKHLEDLFRLLVYRALEIEVLTIENHQLENHESLNSTVNQAIQLIKERKNLPDINKIRSRTRKYLSISRKEFAQSKNPKHRKLMSKSYRFSEGRKQHYPTLKDLKCRVLYSGYRTII